MFSRVTIVENKSEIKAITNITSYTLPQIKNITDDRSKDPTEI